MFDDFWEKDDTYGKAGGDSNAYTTGRIGGHNVVLVFMPGMGKGHSASVTASLRSSFEEIRLGLVVGICGGVPSAPDDGKEILLGDVIISTGIVPPELMALTIWFSVFWNALGSVLLRASLLPMATNSTAG